MFNSGSQSVQCNNSMTDMIGHKTTVLNVVLPGSIVQQQRLKI